MAFRSIRALRQTNSVSAESGSWHTRLMCLAASASLLVAGVCGPATAQDAELPVRLPTTGLAVLDCDPAAPAPPDSCLVRIPSDKTLADVESHDLGDKSAEFRIVRSDNQLPDNLSISSTMVLVDLSKGPNNARLGGWASERAQIRKLVNGMPREGELAIYGFGAELQRQTGFSSNRSDALRAVDAMDLTENNTILSSNISSAIKLLSERNTALLKNLVIVTDGDEEGVGNFEQIVDQAAKAGVTLSALGMFWRPEGNPATTRGIDVLNQITDPQNGLMVPVFLRSAQSGKAVDGFVRRYGQSIGRSGVILPRGEAAAARITVTMNAPILGQSGQTEKEEFRVKFTPANAEKAATEKPDSAQDEPDLIYGYPALQVYIAAGVLAALLLLLLVLVLRRKERPETGPEDDDLDLTGLTGGAADFTQDLKTEFEEPSTPVSPPAPTPKPQPAISAYLIRADTGARLAVRGDRIVIGRSSSNGIVLDDQGVSRVHAELHRNREGGFSVTDLDSLNGTFINEAKVTGTKPVRIGDTIGFSKVRAKLVLP